MPIRTITAPGSTVGVNILKSGTNYTTVRNATAGTNAGNEDNKFTLNAKAGSNFFIRRGILLYDFSTAHLPRGAKVVKAQLILNDVIESAGQTHGDKIRVGWIHNPNTFGAIHANDFNRARYSGQYTTAHQLTNGADGEIIELNHRILLRQLQKAINNKTWLHLVIRNENDHAGTTPAAANSGKVWFDRPNADNNPLQLRIFYRTIGNVRHQGAGTGRTSRSGFGGSNVFSGTNSGFDNG
jgi:hypothetical protein